MKHKRKILLAVLLIVVAGAIYVGDKLSADTTTISIALGNK